MTYTIAITENVQTKESIELVACGNKYYLVYNDTRGNHVISKDGGREIFSVFYKVSQYVTESLFSESKKAEMVKNAA